MHLTLQEAHAVEAGVARVEASTGVEIVTAVVGKCDGYPEIVWKAFALGTVVAALVVVALDLMRPDWVTAYTVWLCIVTILAAGAVSALVAIAVPEYARLFLDRHRAAGEVRQYARAMFVDRRLTRTRARDAVLVLASVLERHVEIVADAGFDGRIDAKQWRSVVDTMTPALAAGHTADAFLRALERIESLLTHAGFVAGAARGNEIADRPIDAKGAR